jgi:hypothetical protein
MAFPRYTPVEFDIALCQSTKGTFPVSVGALIGACFSPVQGWCRHEAKFVGRVASV